MPPAFTSNETARNIISYIVRQFAHDSPYWDYRFWSRARQQNLKEFAMQEYGATIVETDNDKLWKVKFKDRRDLVAILLQID